ncbi:MAG: hypothetical protein EBZ49_17835 [Proteobacteria bacterium]|nr:hypothetical protein [Pseudomonadota bacterium]
MLVVVVAQAIWLVVVLAVLVVVAQAAHITQCNQQQGQRTRVAVVVVKAPQHQRAVRAVAVWLFCAI